MFARTLPASDARMTGAGGLLTVRAPLFSFGRLVSQTECAVRVSSSSRMPARRSSFVSTCGGSADDRSAPFGLSGPTYPVAPGNAPTSLLELGAASVAPAFHGDAA